MKESNPIEMASYAEAVGISKEPVFAWWVPYTLRKRNLIIKAVNSRLKHSSKYGIEVPLNIKEALKFDDKNGNHYWRNAINR